MRLDTVTPAHHAESTLVRRGRGAAASVWLRKGRSMQDAVFEIGADGVDCAAVVEAVRAQVAEKTRQGVYTDARVARAEKNNLEHLRDDESFVTFYMDCLREAVFVDISDFEIYERRRWMSRALVALKRVIWKLLKFYTYRLWSQQNQVNGLLLSAAESIDGKYRARMEALEERVRVLEQGPPA